MGRMSPEAMSVPLDTTWQDVFTYGLGWPIIVALHLDGDAFSSALV